MLPCPSCLLDLMGVDGQLHIPYVLKYVIFKGKINLTKMFISELRMITSIIYTASIVHNEFQKNTAIHRV